MGRKKDVKADKCPNGHKLPAKGCSPLFCVKNATALSKARVSEKPAIEEGGYEETLSFSESRRKAREALVPVPQLEGAAAEEYIEAKKVSLLPQAVAEIEFQLKHGDNKERADAARDVLRMNGMLNRDAPTGVAPTVIINMGGDKSQGLPWLKRKEETDVKEITAPKAG